MTPPNGQLPSVVLKPNDTIPDADELTREYVRSGASTPPATSGPVVNSGGLGHTRVAGVLPVEEGSAEVTTVGARNHSRARSARGSRSYWIFVCLGIAANLLLWAAYAMEQRDPEQIPDWWKSWRARMHHLYMRYVPTKPVLGISWRRP